MPHRNKVLTPGKLIVYIIYIALIVSIILGSLLALSVVSIMKEVDEVDPNIIANNLTETSKIYDLDGNLIEKVETAEYRTVIGIEQMPKQLIQAFLAIEDERFYEHDGVDLIGIMASFRDAFSSGQLRGGSTITQQLVKNTYLTNERKLKRKIHEITMSIDLEKKMSKDQTIEAYLNTVSLGQNAYGVEEAAQTYFSKSAKDLNLVECAMLAGVVKSPTKYPPYKRVSPENFDPNTMEKVGFIELLNQNYVLVYNEENEKRTDVVLSQMLKYGKITQEEYNQAMSVDRKTLIKPGETKTTDITNYFTDYVLKQVEQDLMDKYGWSKKIAQNKIFYGGIQIYSTINVGYQKIMEDAYKNFVEILFGNTNNMRAPIILDTTSDAYANLVDSNGNFIYLAKDNLIVQNSDDIYLAPGEWRYDENGNLCIKSKKLKAYNSNIDIQDYYTIDEKKTLVTHIVGSLPIAKDDFWVENDEIVISSKAIASNDSLFKNKDDYLHIDGNQVYRNKKGVPQPQSAMIIIDYHTGHILAMIGGRDVDGNRFLNRATDSHRQPGSTIKPVSVYLPALENGYTAASPIDDVPIVVNGKIWPNNWYLGFRGIHSLRYAVEQSINVSAVKVLNSMGTNKVVPYLERMGIIDTEHPDRDSFVSASENKEVNDENASSLALGGMTNGLSPLALTAAFGTIANDGVYLKPTSYTKVIDNDGTTLLEYTENPIQAAKPQTAYVMKDILRTVVTRGLGTRAQIPGQVVAGKTGTTQYTADLWFSGFTDYYVASTWIGSDSPKITMKQNSMIAAQLFQYVMSQVHEGLPSVTQFKEPEGIVRASVCTMSGKSPNEFCAGDPRGTVITEIFVKGTEPTEACDAHVEVEICTESNMLANEFCPEETREKVVRVQTTPPYDPESHGGVIPSDMQYRVPSQTCDIHNESNTGESEIIDILNPGGDDEFDINDFLNNNNNENENNTDTPDTNHESHDENEDQKEPPGTIDLLQ